MSKTIFCALAVCLLAGCSSSSKVQSEAAPNVNWAAYPSFGFVALDAEGVDGGPAYQQNIALLKKAISNAMTLRGFRESAQPDLAINLGILVQEEEQTRQTDFRTDRPRYLGQRNYSWKSEEIVVDRYKTGTLDLHVVDAKAGKMLWKGVVKNILPKKASNMEATIESGVQALFSKFPVQPK